MESSLVLHTVGDRGLSRVSVKDFGELRSRVLEKLGVSNSGRQAMLDRILFGIDGSDDPDKHGERFETVAAEDVGSEDLRTCWIDTDEAGSRSKPWRNVVLESAQETVSDSVVSGSATALPV